MILGMTFRTANAQEEAPTSTPQDLERNSVTQTDLVPTQTSSSSPIDNLETTAQTETSEPATVLTSRGETLSKPETVPAESVTTSSGPGSGQVPSQGEGEKAPVSARPTSVPEFSLPEVVITGENELTIGASRLDRQENDVTLGSHDLTGIERGLNDLPGLNKTMTALSAEEPGPSKDSAAVLHLGGGVPGTYGGWGLAGEDFKSIQALVSGYYSNWSGETSGHGLDGDQKAGGNLDLHFLPEEKISFRLEGGYEYNQANLPYQHSASETRQGVDFNAEALLKQTELSQLQIKVSYTTTRLNGWDQSLLSHQADELETRLRWEEENVDPSIENISVEGGWRYTTSDFSSNFVDAYEWQWVDLKTTLKSGENLSLALQAQVQGGTGLNLPVNVYPAADLMWRIFGTSQLNLYWRNDRYVDDIHNTYMNREHIDPNTGFPSPTQVNSELGARFTQKLNERIILSLSASTAQIRGYHQWDDLSDSNPTYIQEYITLPKIQMKKAGASLQWDFARYWQASGLYEWTEGDNTGNDVFNLTALPQNRGILSLYRGDDQWESRLEWVLVSSTNAFATTQATLPAYNILNLSLTYHLSKLFSLWFQGENLLGEGYQVQPGYIEPQYHIRGGVELIF